MTLGDEDILVLAASLPPALEALDVSKVYKNSSLAPVMAALPPTLKRLRYNSRAYHPDDDAVRALVCRMPAGLETLELSETASSSSSSHPDLMAALPASLRVLDLSMSSLEIIGAAYLGMHMPPALQSLALNRAEIADKALTVLAPRLPPTLTKLVLSHNPLGEAGLQALAARIPPALEELELYSFRTMEYGELVAPVREAVPLGLVIHLRARDLLSFQ
ncbi:hypothetical protein H9P43_003895 [Blastocladiella emersonii ATCC 22665]|nr:hypothetical protein H9P43_003895 [Blastocladiella emersonii ATCC 22665]